MTQILHETYCLMVCDVSRLEMLTNAELFRNSLAYPIREISLSPIVAAVS